MELSSLDPLNWILLVSAHHAAGIISSSEARALTVLGCHGDYNYDAASRVYPGRRRIQSIGRVSPKIITAATAKAENLGLLEITRTKRTRRGTSNHYRLTTPAQLPAEVAQRLGLGDDSAGGVVPSKGEPGVVPSRGEPGGGSLSAQSGSLSTQSGSLSTQSGSLQGGTIPGTREPGPGRPVSPPAPLVARAVVVRLLEADDRAATARLAEAIVAYAPDGLPYLGEDAAQIVHDNEPDAAERLTGLLTKVGNEEYLASILEQLDTPEGPTWNN